MIIKAKNEKEYYCLILISLLGCHGSKKNTNNPAVYEKRVFNDVLMAVVDSITSRYASEEEVVFFENRCFDAKKVRSVEKYQKQLNDDTDESTLIEELAKIIENTVRLNLENDANENFKILFDRREINGAL